METKTQQPQQTNKRLYCQKRDITGIGIEMNQYGSRLVLNTDIGRVTCKIVKIVIRESKDNKTGLTYRESVQEKITKENINGALPEMAKKIGEYLKKHKSLPVIMTYSQFTKIDEDTEPEDFYYMYPSDVDCIFSTEIEGLEENLEKQHEKEDKAKKMVSIP